MDIIKFNEAEIVEPEDFTAISENARDDFDENAAKALGWPAHYSSFTVSQAADADSVTIGIGRYYNGSATYNHVEAEDLNLEVYKPLVASDGRWVALLARANEDTINKNRRLETSDEPLNSSEPVTQSVPKVITRTASITVQLGEISPTAVKPTIDEDDCCIAFVLLKSTGVEDIVASEDARVKSVYEIEIRLQAAEANIANINNSVTTIKTDVAGIAQQIEDGPPPWLTYQLVRGQAEIREELDMPDEAFNYKSDYGLVKDFWDLDHPNANFRIMEGIRFPYVNMSNDRIELLDAASDDIVIYDNKIVMPAHARVVRFELPKGGSEQNLSNTTYSVLTAIEKTVSYESMRYGETISVCSNQAQWRALRGRNVGELVYINGQEYTITKKEKPHSGYYGYNLKRIIRYTETKTYTDYITTEVGLTGAIYAQTFPCSQYGILLGVQLYFTHVGSTGDVTLCLCEVRVDGTPDFESVLKTATVAHVDLREGWVEFDLGAVAQEPGNRYGWFTVTTGNHSISMTTGNAFPEGTSFASTDGVWAQGSNENDLSHRLIMAEFKNNRTVVPMEPVSLENGMTEIQMAYAAVQTGSASLSWQVKPVGTDEWIDMDGREDNPLATKPVLCAYQAVLVGTPDNAPFIILDADARIICGRMGTDMVAITEDYTFAETTDSVSLVVYMDEFDEVHHTVAPKLIVGGSVIDADAIDYKPDRESDTRVKVTANFTLGAAVTTLAGRIDATSDSDILLPFGESIQINAF
ncbi:hypothetical protein SAMN04515647_4382 [Cohaesibacter sp. ES.047]|uniref:hypothetical protein n=1 Tax=Cohaesibacter sp. ES.047 TaxID=1798205 RepID=UPI000BB91064|nr:hypothetical protein [Cohaesibacter sp. ES.047]SNY94058.1 hypothetical protein SAMN04515647_4382 [Cohaesibacter sp. ES.047]